MFGQNVVSDKITFNGRWQVQEVFHTIQGEGPLSGAPAVFVRMRHCNLRCTFCDTDFTTGKEEPTTERLLQQIEEARRDTKTALVVITGGEPMLQDLGHLIVPIITKLNMSVQVETAGTVWPESFDRVPMCFYIDSPDRFTIVCSPKTPKVHASIEAHCNHWKYIVGPHMRLSPHDGLPDTGTQPTSVPGGPLYRPRAVKRWVQIWVQPCEEYTRRGALSIPERDVEATSVAHDIAVDAVMKHGHRLSLQTHKILALP